MIRLWERMLETVNPHDCGEHNTTEAEVAVEAG